ncbi:MAG: tetratricopeptide repeat protein [Planctomycetia bacterium]|nr:tetratricopeptide repeat protein [Planctomycetia bacterium]
MLFIRSFPVIFVLVLFSLNGFLGCRSIAIQPGKQPVAHSRNRYLDNQGKGYSYFCTGYFFMLERDWENAAENFEKAIQLDRSSERIVQHLAACYFQLGENEKSIKYIEKLAKIKPKEFSVHYTLATLYETVGRNKEAIEEYEYARRCKTTKLDHVFLADALYRLANLYMNDGMMEKGIACYTSMFDMKLVTEPVKIYYEIGQKYFEKNDIKNALEYFLKAKQADPALSFASFYLTLCYDALNDYESAIQEAKIFLEKEPNNWVMHLALSEVYGKIKNESQKKEEIEKTQVILKNSIDAGSKNLKEYFLLCQIYRNQRKISEAIEIAESIKLISVDKEMRRDVHFLLANLYYEDKKFDRAEEELQMTLKLDPDFHEANNFLGYLFVENNKNLDKAIQLINKALEAQPQNGAYLDSLGWAYYKKAQVEGRNDYLVIALKKLLEAVRFMDEPDIYEHVGDVHYSLGDWDKAVNAWEKAIALYRQELSYETKIEAIEIKLEKVRRLISVEERGTRFIGNRREVGNGIQPYILKKHGEK